MPLDECVNFYGITICWVIFSQGVLFTVSTIHVSIDNYVEGSKVHNALLLSLWMKKERDKSAWNTIRLQLVC